MSLVAAIRDYIDIINSSYDSIPTLHSLSSKNFLTEMQSLILPTISYIFGSFRYGIVYLLSFQWLRDIVYLPLLIPQLSLSILQENCHPLENPLLNFFTFLEGPAYANNKFFIGFFNSFFACLPISAAHILNGRRLLVQGIPAGVAAGSGAILGQCWFVACVVLGLRGFLAPWFSLEPFNYLLGLGLLVNIVYKIIDDRRIRITKWTNRAELFRYFVTSLLLTWCEQTSIFQYLGNLTIGPEPTSLDSFSSTISGLGIDGGYVIGFFLGSCLFTLLLGFIGLLLKRVWMKGLRWATTSYLTNQLNKFFLVTLILFSFASVPYYGIDYLVTNRLGFVPQDRALEGTLFYPTTMTDITKNIGRISDYKSFDTDVSTFDQGVYLQEAKPPSQSFENLNYQGEYAWTKRISKFVKITKPTPSGWYKLFITKDEDKEAAKTQPLNIDSIDRQREVDTSYNDDPNTENKLLSSLDQNGDITNENGTISQLFELENNVGRDDIFYTGDQGDDDIAALAKPLTEDKNIEKQFLSLFDAGFSPLFITETTKPSPLQKGLKRKFVENPVYRLLLRIDIDSFLNRQPSKHLLSPDEEKTLFQKRQIVGHYYNTLRQYNQLQNWDQFQSIYDGSKSFANRVYNQQFKGTLKVVRRLFSITMDDEQNKNITSSPLTPNPPFRGDNRRVLKFDQLLFQEEGKKSNHNLNLHEELIPLKDPDGSNYPFLEATNPRPLYAGWDEELRKLVLTNRSMPRSLAMYQTGKADPVILTGKYGRFDHVFSQQISFTAWPLPEEILVTPKNKLKIPYNLAFDSSKNPNKQRLAESLDVFAEMQDQGGVGGNTWDMARWPSNLRMIESRPETMPFTRGGFVWPGHSQLKFKFNRG